MSPEQAMGEREITARSDVYALGAVLYEMLTGDPPFTGSTAQAIVARVVTESPRPLLPQRHTIPPHVEAAVLTALEKLPADRFASAAEFAAALKDTSYATTVPVPAGILRLERRPGEGQGGAEHPGQHAEEEAAQVGGNERGECQHDADNRVEHPLDRMEPGQQPARHHYAAEDDPEDTADANVDDDLDGAVHKQAADGDQQQFQACQDEQQATPERAAAPPAAEAGPAAAEGAWRAAASAAALPLIRGLAAWRRNVRAGGVLSLRACALAGNACMLRWFRMHGAAAFCSGRASAGLIRRRPHRARALAGIR